MNMSKLFGSDPSMVRAVGDVLKGMVGDEYKLILDTSAYTGGSVGYSVHERTPTGHDGIPCYRIWVGPPLELELCGNNYNWLNARSRDQVIGRWELADPTCFDKLVAMMYRAENDHA